MRPSGDHGFRQNRDPAHDQAERVTLALKDRSTHDQATAVPKAEAGLPLSTACNSEDLVLIARRDPATVLKIPRAVSVIPRRC